MDHTVYIFLKLAFFNSIFWELSQNLDSSKSNSLIWLLNIILLHEYVSLSTDLGYLIFFPSRGGAQWTSLFMSSRNFSRVEVTFLDHRVYK